MGIYRIAPRYRWHLRFWSAAGFAIATLAIFIGGCCMQGGSTWRIAVAIGGAVCAAYLVIEDLRLGRIVETTEQAIRFRRATGGVRTVSWNDITQLVNYPAYGFLQLNTATGDKLTVAHQFENVQTLVNETVTRTGCQVLET